jgi:hypothetical protein
MWNSYAMALSNDMTSFPQRLPVLSIIQPVREQIKLRLHERPAQP